MNVKIWLLRDQERKKLYYLNSKNINKVHVVDFFEFIVEEKKINV